LKTSFDRRGKTPPANENAEKDLSGEKQKRGEESASLPEAFLKRLEKKVP